MEAEYISASAAAQEIVNLKGVLSEFNNVNCVSLKIDNLSAISMINTYENSKRGKHIDIRYHFIKNLCLNKEICVNYVSSNHNVADLLTKALPKQKFVMFRDMLLQ